MKHLKSFNETNDVFDGFKYTNIIRKLNTIYTNDDTVKKLTGVKESLELINLNEYKVEFNREIEHNEYQEMYSFKEQFNDVHSIMIFGRYNKNFNGIQGQGFTYEVRILKNEQIVLNLSDLPACKDIRVIGEFAKILASEFGGWRSSKKMVNLNDKTGIFE